MGASVSRAEAPAAALPVGVPAAAAPLLQKEVPKVRAAVALCAPVSCGAARSGRQAAV